LLSKNLNLFKWNLDDQAMTVVSSSKSNDFLKEKEQEILKLTKQVEQLKIEYQNDVEQLKNENNTLNNHIAQLEILINELESSKAQLEKDQKTSSIETHQMEVKRIDNPSDDLPIKIINFNVTLY
jgi:DNA repair exonuclease SbcCD ATPase subunit